MTKANAIRMKKSAWQNSQKRRRILVHLFVLNAENTVDELKYRTRERTYLAGSTAGGALASARVSGGAVVRTHLAVGTRRIADGCTTHNSHIAAQFSASVHLAAATYNYLQRFCLSIRVPLCDVHQLVSTIGAEDTGYHINPQHMTAFAVGPTVFISL